MEAVSDEFHKEYYKNLYAFVREEYSKTTVYPPAEDIFNALHLTPLSEVRVVILGQDPYFNEHQAHGLCFFRQAAVGQTGIGVLLVQQGGQAQALGRLDDGGLGVTAGADHQLRAVFADGAAGLEHTAEIMV